MISPNRKQRGFTLMEMMIALLIGAVLVTPMYIVTRSMSQQTHTGQMEVETMQRARMGVDSLIKDLRLTGLSASPNTEIDGECQNACIPGSTAQYRSAVAHLNRGLPGNDAILLTGNFLGGEAYAASLTGSNQFHFRRTYISEYNCTTQFNQEYAHAHIVNSIGMSMDAKVQSASWSGGTCSLSLRIQDIDPSVASTVEEVYVSANQTAFYWVERQDDHDVLVRYFVDYLSPGTSSDGCTIEGATDISNVTLPGNSVIVPSTRQVIAEYVEDFQVWFRPVTKFSSGTVDWISPHIYPISGGAGVVDGSGNFFSKGFVLPDEAYVFARNVSDDPLTDLDDLSCLDSAAKTIGAEHVRSALIRLSVRTEKTDQSIDATAFDLDNNRIAGYTISEYKIPSDGPITDKPGAAYKLKTLVTEAPMPNLAARSSLIEFPSLPEDRCPP